MFLPLYVWHQANFPDKPVTFLSLREETMESLKATWGLREPSLILPFGAALMISFVISAFAYVFLKRRLWDLFY
jgi:hypothetical protein